jgi:hypothetical protein
MKQLLNNYLKMTKRPKLKAVDFLHFSVLMAGSGVKSSVGGGQQG